jgi:hypothetical protein
MDGRGGWGRGTDCGLTRAAPTSHADGEARSVASRSAAAFDETAPSSRHLSHVTYGQRDVAGMGRSVTPQRVRSTGNRLE